MKILAFILDFAIAKAIRESLELRGQTLELIAESA
jgi:hypothetical protein